MRSKYEGGVTENLFKSDHGESPAILIAFDNLVSELKNVEKWPRNGKNTYFWFS